jgi:hypothetical protein
MRHDADQHETAASQRRLTAVLYSPHMATKTRTKKSKATLDSVLSTVERGFADLEAEMDRGFAAVANDITDIKSKMATKDDMASLGGQLTSVEPDDPSPHYVWFFTASNIPLAPRAPSIHGPLLGPWAPPAGSPMRFLGATSRLRLCYAIKARAAG